ncbi:MULTISPECIES: hypothetical protein [Halocynthiibacter]|uniref:Uncharacterized protein n=1 Tax=Halocynthiibacter halioticoli TaxID=2986804 RepID=A0AAE3IXY7_9RHOB|nr:MULTISPECIES: hypothetical protein [Halocynthiibacter]MCV6823160.1 hypothetical protein [Halocynthiibacter halioticoli]MCW4056161.1 hypothetical protein [Halocynthiibacter sp. SDUM655004]
MNIDQIVVPLAFDTPEALKYVRSNFLDIIREYNIQQAGIRATEPNSQRMNIKRLQIEGVIIEAFASSPLKGYYVGHISSIASRLGLTRTHLKPMIEGNVPFEVDGWQNMINEEREAVLCALGAEHNA